MAGSFIFRLSAAFAAVVGIALAFMPPITAEGDTVDIDVRGKSLPGRVVATPFV